MGMPDCLESVNCLFKLFGAVFHMACHGWWKKVSSQTIWQLNKWSDLFKMQGEQNDQSFTGICVMTTFRTMMFSVSAFNYFYFIAQQKFPNFSVNFLEIWLFPNLYQNSLPSLDFPWLLPDCCTPWPSHRPNQGFRVTSMLLCHM